MAALVIDEWLWADLRGANEGQQQKETFQFLQAIFKKCDRIVTVKGSPFDQKYLGLFDRHNQVRNRLALYYRDFFRYNSLKSFLIEENQLAELSSELSLQVEQSDHYVVRAFLASQASAIVTTDVPLKEVLDKHGIPCSYRDEFVRDYILRYG